MCPNNAHLILRKQVKSAILQRKELHLTTALINQASNTNNDSNDVHQKIISEVWIEYDFI